MEQYSRRDFLRLGTAAGVGALVMGCTRFHSSKLIFEGEIDGLYVKRYQVDNSLFFTEENANGIMIYSADKKSLLKVILDYDRSGKIGDSSSDQYIVYNPNDITDYIKYQSESVLKSRNSNLGLPNRSARFSGKDSVSSGALKISAQRLNEANDLYQDLVRKIDAKRLSGL